MTKKTHTIDIIMGNPKMASLIKDAMKSPIGSSKREQASALMRTMRKMNGGGRGGVGGQYDLPMQSLVPSSPVPGPVSKSSAVVPSIQPKKAGILEAGTPIPAIYSGIGDVGKDIGSTFNNITKMYKDLSVAQKKIVWNMFSDIGKVTTNMVASTGHMITGSSGKPLPYLLHDFGKPSKYFTKAQKPDGTIVSPTQSMVTAEQQKKLEDERMLTDTTGTTGTESMISTAGADGAPSTEQGDFIDNWRSGLSDEDKVAYADLYKALKSGIGAKTFANQAMVTDFMMKNPDLASDPNIAYAASLTGQADALSKKLKEESGYNQRANDLTVLQKRGVSITDDLKNYITGRDKYIEGLDKMIDKANDAYLVADIGNPYVAKQMQNYQNYLYVLKGRQQKRYTDFLNSAIVEFNGQLTVAQDAYNTSVTSYNSELALKTSFLKEDYENTKQAKEDMYANIEGREKMMLDLGLTREKLTQEQAKTAENAINALTGMTSKDLKTAKMNFETSFFLQNEGIYPDADDWDSAIKADPNFAKEYTGDLWKVLSKEMLANATAGVNQADIKIELDRIKNKNVQRYKLGKNEKQDDKNIIAANILFDNIRPPALKKAVMAEIYKENPPQTDEERGWWKKIFGEKGFWREG